MNIWGENVDAEGNATVMVGPATIPELAKLFDPLGPHIYLDSFNPLLGFGGDFEWRDAIIPLSKDRLLSPQKVQARRLRFDILLQISVFLELTGDLADQGGFVAQIEHEPTEPFGNLNHPAARRNWYEKHGLVVAFDLPHKNEGAQIVAIDTATRDAAISRLIT